MSTEKTAARDHLSVGVICGTLGSMSMTKAELIRLLEPCGDDEEVEVLFLEEGTGLEGRRLSIEDVGCDSPPVVAQHQRGHDEFWFITATAIDVFDLLESNRPCWCCGGDNTDPSTGEHNCPQCPPNNESRDASFPSTPESEAS